MEILISTSTSKPIYEQITSQIKAQIMSGALQPGEALPSMRALAKSIHVSVITVQKAYEDLQRDGFIETTVGRGTFVAPLTPEQVGKVCRAAYRQWDADLYRSYLARFALPPRKEIKALSKGMRMKLLIAAALSHRPKLLILDEATSGLDPVMRDEMLEVFWDFVQDEEHSILMSSHITTDLERIADRITFLHRGKLLFCKPKDELLDRYGILRCGAADFAKIDKADILACRREDYQWSVLVADKEAARRKYRPQVLDDATIDDILLLYVKGEQNR